MRAFTHPVTGPLDIRLRLAVGKITIKQHEGEPGSRPAATVTLEPIRPGDTTAEDAINNTAISVFGEDQKNLDIQAPFPDITHGMTTVRQGNSVTTTWRDPATGASVTSHISGHVSGHIHQAINLDGVNINMVNGRIHGGIHQHGLQNSATGTGGIHVTLILAGTESLHVRALHADLVLVETLPSLSVHIDSGNVLVGYAEELQVTTDTADVAAGAGRVAIKSGTGDVMLTRARWADIKTSTGDINVKDCQTAHLSTSNGRIQAHNCQIVDARSNTGRIDADEIGTQADLDTSTGHITITSKTRARIRARSRTGGIVYAAPYATVDADSTTGTVRKLT